MSFAIPGRDNNDPYRRLAKVIFGAPCRRIAFFDSRLYVANWLDTSDARRRFSRKVIAVVGGREYPRRYVCRLRNSINAGISVAHALSAVKEGPKEHSKGK